VLSCALVRGEWRHAYEARDAKQMAKKPEALKSGSGKALRLVVVSLVDFKPTKKLAPAEFLKGGDLVLTDQAWPETAAAESKLRGFDGVAVQAGETKSLLDHGPILSRIAARSPLLGIVDDYEDRTGLQLLGLGLQEVLSRSNLDPQRLRRRLVHSMVRFRRLQKVMKVAAGQSALQSLNRIPLGIMVVDRDCRILHSNDQAQALLGNDNGLVRRPDGRCATNSKKLNEELQDVVVRLTAGESTDEHDQETLVIPGKDGGLGLSLLLVPAGTQADHQNAVIFITSPGTEVSVSHATLQRLYTLTDAEAALAEKLVQGKTLEEIAAETGRSAHTLRSQLKQIFQKTDTNRQSQLIKMVLTGPAVLGQPSRKSEKAAAPVKASASAR
jgi:DNA-binding CsgD family transcriptional regulator